ncbi:MAG: hypothetical protein AAF629_10235 [Chloroflexota bacterium]
MMIAKQEVEVGTAPYKFDEAIFRSRMPSGMKLQKTADGSWQIRHWWVKLESVLFGMLILAINLLLIWALILQTDLLASERLFGIRHYYLPNRTFFNSYIAIQIISVFLTLNWLLTRNRIFSKRSSFEWIALMTFSLPIGFAFVYFFGNSCFNLEPYYYLKQGYGEACYVSAFNMWLWCAAGLFLFIVPFCNYTNIIFAADKLTIQHAIIGINQSNWTQQTYGKDQIQDFIGTHGIQGLSVADLSKKQASFLHLNIIFRYMADRIFAFDSFDDTFDFRKLSLFIAVKISSSNDKDIEKFVLNVQSDTDPIRRDFYNAMPCIISSTSNLSSNSIRLLEKTFGEVYRS